MSLKTAENAMGDILCTLHEIREVERDNYLQEIEDIEGRVIVTEMIEKIKDIKKELTEFKKRIDKMDDYGGEITYTRVLIKLSNPNYNNFVDEDIDSDLDI